MTLFIFSITTFIIFGIFTLFIAPHINERLQLIMIVPSVFLGVLIFISLFIIPLLQVIF